MCENQLWSEVYNYIHQNQINILNDGYTMAIFHDKEYKARNVEIEVQVSVDQSYEDNKKIKFYETKEVAVASLTFNGSYDKMPEVTKAALTWIELHNYELVQPTFNIYHISPAQDDNPDNWVSESCFIIKDRSK